MAKDSSIYKYNIFTLAKDLGLPPETVRQRLRRAEVEKNDDGMYGWTSFAKYNEVKKAVKAVPTRGPQKQAAARAKQPKKVTRKKVAKRVRQPIRDGDD